MGNEQPEDQGIMVRKPELRRRPSEIERFVDRAMRGFVPWPRMELWRHRAPFWQEDWLPDLDVFERDGDMVVRADLPGMKREDIDVAVENDMLVIKGIRHEEKETKNQAYRRSERSTGEFYRSINLPEGFDADSIKATYIDGVLEVVVPIPAARERKKLKVEVK